MSALSLAVILQLAGDPQCSAPGLQPHLLTALVQQESGGDPLVLGDDVRHLPIHPATAEDAERIVLQRWQSGMSTGLGLTQLTASSEREFSQKFGIPVRAAFDPCVNLRVGSMHLLRAALSTYNSGNPTGAPGYVRQVLARVPGVGAAGTGAPGADLVTPTPPNPPPVLHDSLHGGEDTPGLQNWMIVPDKQQVSGPQSADPPRPFDLGSAK